MSARHAVFVAAASWVSSLSAASAVAAPYTDPKLLDVPWGYYSFARPAWRGYLETVPAVDYLDGLGVVWAESPPGKSDDRMAQELAWAGFRRVRIEIPWGAVKWDETGFVDEAAARLASKLASLKTHGLRPLILLNANHLQPCPVQWRELRVERSTPKGSRELVVAGDLRGIAPRTATLMSLADGVTPGPTIESYVPGRHSSVALSKELPRAVAAGEVLKVAVLAYAPLHPVGTPEFERTASGWLRYVELVAAFVEASYGPDFDVEIWNEFTFGSGFLSIDNYRSPQARSDAPEPFHRGGRIWELANRTVEQLHREHPAVRAIWGFSNTSFFHVKVAELPPLVAGQSYHPYGTGRLCYADAVERKQDLLLDAAVPPGCIAQPEGWAHSWYQTESLVRLLAPAVRNVRPPGSPEFAHFITEHGFRPDELGISDRSLAQRAKTKFLLRATLLWLNKGIRALYVHDAYDRSDLGFGMFDASGDVSAAMRALHNLTSRLAGASRVFEPRALAIEVARDGSPGLAEPGDSQRAWSQDDLVAVLPFQVADDEFALGVYVMTQDFPAELAPQPYRVTISGVRGTDATVAAYVPESGAVEPVRVVSRSEDAIEVALLVTDVPKLLEIDDARAPRARGAGNR